MENMRTVSKKSPKTMMYVAILIIAVLLMVLLLLISSGTEGIVLFGNEAAPEGLEVFKATQDTGGAPPALPELP